MNLIQHFVDGKIIPGKSNKKGKVFNPATGEQEKEVCLATKVDLDQAVTVPLYIFSEILFETKKSLSFEKEGEYSANSVFIASKFLTL